MKYDAFIDRVQERAGIERREAVQLAEAALEGWESGYIASIGIDQGRSYTEN